MNWITVYVVVSIWALHQVLGSIVKCGEDIVVGRGVKKTLRFWSSDDELMKVEVFPERSSADVSGLFSAFKENIKPEHEIRQEGVHRQETLHSSHHELTDSKLQIHKVHQDANHHTDYHAAQMDNIKSAVPQSAPIDEDQKEFEKDHETKLQRDKDAIGQDSPSGIKSPETAPLHSVSDHDTKIFNPDFPSSDLKLMTQNNQDLFESQDHNEFLQAVKQQLQRLQEQTLDSDYDDQSLAAIKHQLTKLKQSEDPLEHGLTLDADNYQVQHTDGIAEDEAIEVTTTSDVNLVDPGVQDHLPEHPESFETSGNHFQLGTIEIIENLVKQLSDSGYNNAAEALKINLAKLKDVASDSKTFDSIKAVIQEQLMNIKDTITADPSISQSETLEQRPGFVSEKSEQYEAITDTSKQQEVLPQITGEHSEIGTDVNKYITEMSEMEDKKSEMPETAQKKAEMQDTADKKTEMLDTEDTKAELSETVEISDSAVKEAEQADTLKTEEKKSAMSDIADKKAEMSDTTVQQETVSQTVNNISDMSETAEKKEEIPNIADKTSEVLETEDTKADLSNTEKNEAEILDTAVPNAEITDTIDKQAGTIETEDKKSEILDTADKEAEMSDTAVPNAEITDTVDKQAGTFETEVKKSEISDTADKEAEMSDTAIPNAEITDTVDKQAGTFETEDKISEISDTADKEAEMSDTAVPNAEITDTVDKQAGTFETEDKISEISDTADKEAEMSDTAVPNAEITDTVDKQAGTFETEVNRSEISDTADKEAEMSDTAVPNAEITDTVDKQAGTFETEVKKSEISDTADKEAEMSDTAVPNAEITDTVDKQAGTFETEVKKSEISDTADKEAEMSDTAVPNAEITDTVDKQAGTFETEDKISEISDTADKEAEMSDTAVPNAEITDTIDKQAGTFETEVKKSEISDTTDKVAEMSDTAVPNAEITDTVDKQAGTFETEDKISEISDTADKEAEMSDTAVPNAEITDTIDKQAGTFETEVKKAEISDTADKEAEMSDTAVPNAEITDTVDKQAGTFETEDKISEISDTADKEAEMSDTAVPNAEITDTIDKQAGTFETEVKKAEISDTADKEAEMSDTAVPNAEITDTIDKQAGSFETEVKKSEISDTRDKEAEMSDTAVPNAEITDTVDKKAGAFETEVKKSKISDTRDKEAEMSDTAVPNAEITDTIDKQAGAFETEVKKSEISDTADKEAEMSDTAVPNAEITDTVDKQAGTFETEDKISEISDTADKEAEMSDTAVPNAEITDTIDKQAGTFETEVKKAEISDTADKEAEMSDTAVPNAEITDTIDEQAGSFETEVKKSEISDTADKEAEMSDTAVPNAEITDTVDKKAGAFETEVKKSKISDTRDKEAEMSDTAVPNAEITDTIDKQAGTFETEVKKSEISDTADKEAEMSDTAVPNSEITDTVDKQAGTFETEVKKSEISDTADKEAEMSDTAVPNAEITDTVDKQAGTFETEVKKLEISDTADKEAEISDTAVPNAEITDTVDKQAGTFETEVKKLEISDTADKEAEMSDTAVPNAEITDTVDKQAGTFETEVQKSEISDTADKEAEIIDTADKTEEMSVAAEKEAGMSDITDTKSEVLDIADKKAGMADPADTKSDTSDKKSEVQEVPDIADEKAGMSTKKTDMQDAAYHTAEVSDTADKNSEMPETVDQKAEQISDTADNKSEMSEIADKKSELPTNDDQTVEMPDTANKKSEMSETINNKVEVPERSDGNLEMSEVANRKSDMLETAYQKEDISDTADEISEIPETVDKTVEQEPIIAGEQDLGQQYKKHNEESPSLHPNEEKATLEVAFPNNILSHILKQRVKDDKLTHDEQLPSKDAPLVTFSNHESEKSGLEEISDAGEIANLHGQESETAVSSADVQGTNTVNLEKENGASLISLELEGENKPEISVETKKNSVEIISAGNKLEPHEPSETLVEEGVGNKILDTSDIVSGSNNDKETIDIGTYILKNIAKKGEEETEYKHKVTATINESKLKPISVVFKPDKDDITNKYLGVIDYENDDVSLLAASLVDDDFSNLSDQVTDNIADDVITTTGKPTLDNEQNEHFQDEPVQYNTDGFIKDSSSVSDASIPAFETVKSHEETEKTSENKSGNENGENSHVDTRIETTAQHPATLEQDFIAEKNSENVDVSLDGDDDTTAEKQTTHTAVLHEGDSSDQLPSETSSNTDHSKHEEILIPFSFLTLLSKGHDRNRQENNEQLVAKPSTVVQPKDDLVAPGIVPVTLDENFQIDGLNGDAVSQDADNTQIEKVAGEESATGYIKLGETGDMKIINGNSVFSKETGSDSVLSALLNPTSESSNSHNSERHAIPIPYILSALQQNPNIKDYNKVIIKEHGSKVVIITPHSEVVNDSSVNDTDTEPEEMDKTMEEKTLQPLSEGLKTDSVTGVQKHEESIPDTLNDTPSDYAVDTSRPINSDSSDVDIEREKISEKPENEFRIDETEINLRASSFGSLQHADAESLDDEVTTVTSSLSEEMTADMQKSEHKENTEEEDSFADDKPAVTETEPSFTFSGIEYREKLETESADLASDITNSIPATEEDGKLSLLTNEKGAVNEFSTGVQETEFEPGLTVSKFEIPQELEIVTPDLSFETTSLPKEVRTDVKENEQGEVGSENEKEKLNLLFVKDTNHPLVMAENVHKIALEAEYPLPVHRPDLRVSDYLGDELFTETLLLPEEIRANIAKENKVSEKQHDTVPPGKQTDNQESGLESTLSSGTDEISDPDFNNRQKPDIIFTNLPSEENLPLETSITTEENSEFSTDRAKVALNDEGKEDNNFLNLLEKYIINDSPIDSLIPPEAYSSQNMKDNHAGIPVSEFFSGNNDNTNNVNRMSNFDSGNPYRTDIGSSNRVSNHFKRRHDNAPPSDIYRVGQQRPSLSSLLQTRKGLVGTTGHYEGVSQVRRDDSNYLYGGDSPFFIKLPGSPNAVPVFLQYEPVKVKYVSSEELSKKYNQHNTANSAFPDSNLNNVRADLTEEEVLRNSEYNIKNEIELGSHPDPFFLMEAPDLGQNSDKTFMERMDDAASSPLVREDSFTVNLKGKLNFDEEKVMHASITDDTPIRPGEYFIRNPDNSYSSSDTATLTNPVFSLGSKITLPSQTPGIPQYTPFPLTTNPPRTETTTNMENDIFPRSATEQMPDNHTSFSKNISGIRNQTEEAEDTEHAPIPSIDFNETFDAVAYPDIPVQQKLRDELPVLYHNEDSFSKSVNPEVVTERDTLSSPVSAVPPNDDDFDIVALANVLHQNQKVWSDKDVTSMTDSAAWRAPSWDTIKNNSSAAAPDGLVRPFGDSPWMDGETDGHVNSSRDYAAFYSAEEIPGLDPLYFSYRRMPGREPRKGAVEEIKSFIETLPIPLRKAVTGESVSLRLKKRSLAAGEQIYCEWNFKTEPGLYMLVTFHNLSAPFTVDCFGAYIEVERESNGYGARWCGNRVDLADSRQHVIFAKHEVRIAVYDNGDTTKMQATGFEADIEAIDLFDSTDYETFMRTKASHKIRRLMEG